MTTSKTMSPRVRRLLIAVAVIGLVVSAMRIAIANMNLASSASHSPTVPSAEGTPGGVASPAPPQPTGNSGNSGAAAPTDAKQLSAVGAAASAVDLLSTAMFVAPDKAQQIIAQTVVPEKRQALAQSLAASGPTIARSMGYGSIDEANAASVYYVQTMKYKVVEFSDNTATVALYVVSHWVAANNNEYRVPGLTIVHLRSVNNSWQYVSSEDPPKGQAPALKADLTFEQTEALFDPYVKEYVNYVQGP